MPSERRVLRGLCIAAFALACGGGDRPAGEIEGAGRPRTALAAAARRQADARGAIAPREAQPGLASKPILFGDLHVHTTWSFDAFLYSLPLLVGEGYALTDHAESLTPAHWMQEKESVRRCNARAGDPSDPDRVAFTGFEWTQVGLTPETHYGHKNVIFPGTGEGELPVRPIGSVEGEGGWSRDSRWWARLGGSTSGVGRVRRLPVAARRAGDDAPLSEGRGLAVAAGRLHRGGGDAGLPPVLLARRRHHAGALRRSSRH
jgi:hypothetical protein